MQANIEAFFDEDTGTVSYVVFDEPGGCAAVIDPVLGFDMSAGRACASGAEAISRFISDKSLTLQWILETHAHADHLSAAQHLKRQHGGTTAIGAPIGQVQAVFKTLFNLEPQFAADGSQFDHLFANGEAFHIGKLSAKAMLLPGHTPADMAYDIAGTVFVGDTLFMPDVGTARCDFPGGDARALYRSIQQLLALAPHTPLMMCHDYPPNGRAPAWRSTVLEQRRHNIHVHEGVSEQAFVAMRTARDKTLGMPRLMLPAVQVNIRAGAMPPAEANGVSYLKIPISHHNALNVVSL